MNQARLSTLNFAISAPCRGILEPLEITHSHSMKLCYCVGIVSFLSFSSIWFFVLLLWVLRQVSSVAEDSVL